MAAGAEVFAARGFRDATVREICEKAAANIAAVNYHFRDKEGLYSAIMRSAIEGEYAKYPSTLGVTPTSTPQERLGAFVKAFLLRVLSEGKPAWLGKLIAREMVEPSPFFDTLVEEMIRPNHAILNQILKDLMGPDATPIQLQHIGSSIVGQCLFHHCGRQVINRLHPHASYGPGDIEQLSQHITAFSLAGIRDVVEQNKQAAAGPCPISRMIKAAIKRRSGHVSTSSRSTTKKGQKP